MRRGGQRAARICVIIVNWNGRQHLEHCLPSVAATEYPNFRMMVVDNGSSDDSLSWLQANYPEAEVVALDRNLGFAGANNVAMGRALASGAEYVALLNNDTRVEQGWLEALAAAAEADERVAICQARQRTWEGGQEIRFHFIPEWAEAEYTLEPVGPAGEAEPTLFASGCAMLVRCTALRRIGLFDERYFMYVEDVDLSLRAWIAGYRVMDTPAAVVYHRFSASAPNKGHRIYLGYRNQLTTILKLYEPGTLGQYAGAIGRRWLRNRGAWRATLAALQMLPGTMGRRRRVQAGRRAYDAAFLETTAPRTAAPRTAEQ